MRGSIEDILIWIVMVFAISFTAILVYNVMDEFESTDLEVGDNLTNAKEGLAYFDTGILLISIGMFMAMMIGAVLIRVHPVFAPVGFMALLFIIISVPGLANFWSEMMADPTYGAYSGVFPITTFIFEHLPIIVATVGTVFLVVMFGLSGYIRGRIGV